MTGPPGDGRAVADAWAQLQPAPDDGSEPLIQLHLGPDKLGRRHDVLLSPGAASALIEIVRSRPQGLVQLLQEMVDLRIVKMLDVPIDKP
jgi:hypothetical protein